MALWSAAGAAKTAAIDEKMSEYGDDHELQEESLSNVMPLGEA